MQGEEEKHCPEQAITFCWFKKLPHLFEIFALL